MVQRIHSKLQSKWQHTLKFLFEEKELRKLQFSVWAYQVNRCKMFLIRSRDEYIYTRFDWNRRQRSLDGKEEDQLARESINNFFGFFFRPKPWTQKNLHWIVWPLPHTCTPLLCLVTCFLRDTWQMPIKSTENPNLTSSHCEPTQPAADHAGHLAGTGSAGEQLLQPLSSSNIRDTRTWGEINKVIKNGIKDVKRFFPPCKHQIILHAQLTLISFWNTRYWQHEWQK